MTSAAPNASRTAARTGYLALVFAAVRDAAVVLDPDGRIADLNPAAERLFGAAVGERLGRTTDNETPGLNAADEDGARRRALHDGRWEGEISFITLDGRSGTLQATLVALTNELGRKEGLVAIYRDISAKKAVEDALREAQKRLRFALEGRMKGCGTGVSKAETSTTARRPSGCSVTSRVRWSGAGRTTWDQNVHPR